MPEQDQCFPFYVYDEDGTNRRENITDWALEQFRTHYRDKKIGKWDIFHYVYGVLHHPGYRDKFADNLKRELPRIPFAPDFRAFAKAGEKLARLHLDYETLEPWPLKWIETPGVPLSYRVEKMKLSKDKSTLVVNPSLTLAGIPPGGRRVPPGQPQRAGMGDRPVPGPHGQAERHQERSEPRGRRTVHRATGRAGGAGERGDGENRQRAARRVCVSTRFAPRWSSAFRRCGRLKPERQRIEHLR